MPKRYRVGRRYGPTLSAAFDRVAAYQSPDGQIELDAVAEGPSPWLVEVKWRNRPVSRADCVAFTQKAHSVGERLKWGGAVREVGWRETQRNFSGPHTLIQTLAYAVWSVPTKVKLRRATHGFARWELTAVENRDTISLYTQ